MTRSALQYILFAGICSVSMTSAVLGQAPDSVSFQGYLTNPGGDPITQAGVNMTFKLYKNSLAVWTESQSVDVVGGVFNVLLGKVSALDTMAFNVPMELGITVGGDSEISPRTPLAAAAYAKALPGLYTFYREDGSDRSYNVIGGGPGNILGAGVTGATISGGGGYFVESGIQNEALNDFVSIGGGGLNIASGRLSTIGGGVGNAAEGSTSTVGGGSNKAACGVHSPIGGGQSNTAGGTQSVVSGGYNNHSSSFNSSVGGGEANRATGTSSTVPGGGANQARGNYSFASGSKARAKHLGTFVWNDRSFNGGNDSLVSTGDNQFLIRAAGGVGIGTNAPNGQLTVLGDADVSGGIAVGHDSPRTRITVRGPDHPHDGPIMLMYGSSADQFESGRIRFVEGTALANYRGAFIQYDGSGNELHIGVHDATDSLSTSDSNVITIERASGDLGIHNENPAYSLHVGTSTSNGNGAYLSDVGIWTNASSRTFKTDFESLDKIDILERVVRMPVTEWSYRGQNDERHVGPVAEDFFQTFGLGSDDKYIGGSDESGVALAAIQGLYELVREQQSEIERLRLLIEAK